MDRNFKNSTRCIKSIGFIAAEHGVLSRDGAVCLRTFKNHLL